MLQDGVCLYVKSMITQLVLITSAVHDITMAIKTVCYWNTQHLKVACLGVGAFSSMQGEMPCMKTLQKSSMLSLNYFSCEQ